MRRLIGQVPAAASVDGNGYPELSVPPDRVSAANPIDPDKHAEISGDNLPKDLNVLGISEKESAAWCFLV